MGNASDTRAANYPAHIILSHFEEPSEPFFNTGVICIACQDKWHINAPV